MALNETKHRKPVYNERNVAERRTKIKYLSTQAKINIFPRYNERERDISHFNIRQSAAYQFRVFLPNNKQYFLKCKTLERLRNIISHIWSNISLSCFAHEKKFDIAENKEKRTSFTYHGENARGAGSIRKYSLTF